MAASTRRRSDERAQNSFAGPVVAGLAADGRRSVAPPFPQSEAVATLTPRWRLSGEEAMNEVLASLPPLAPGVQFYDRPLKVRDPRGEMREVDGGRNIQLFNRAAPEGKRLATIIVSPGGPDTPEELAQKFVEYCSPYGYFAS